MTLFPLSISFILISGLFNQDLIILVAVFWMLALDGGVLASSFDGLGGVDVAVHVFHEEVVIEVLPHDAQIVGGVAGETGHLQHHSVMAFDG